ncbi:ABC transporter ATP-binding protein [Aquabacter spiritensis]|uniref:Iron complex transport system ATP-binding protein n=1 Tax=Aquabacter spiritensis TaxID=933073 RepID=A0A4R3LUT7_9HYPH|nr:ABC transporter ATP-binding protein [Aquabacter spiritensis]TCT04370.1 iron complex transport system ATP-binding protein [Aquabacter spiritensis]
MILAARDIAIVQGGARLLSGVSLDLRGGEMLGLIGPNGAGKTTLLRALCGLAPLAAGAVTYDGQPLADLGAAARGRSVAYLAQDGRIHWPLPVEEVVALGRLPHGAARIDAAVLRALEAADLLGLRSRAAGTLSGGERARVLLARALAVEAPLLLADEPVAALDPSHQLQMMEALRAAARGGAAVVVVLHDLTLAARFCDRLLLLKAGRAIAEGRPAEVLTAGRVLDAYGVTVESGVRDGELYVIPWRRREPGA